MADKKTLELLNLCLKTSRMGVWQATLDMNQKKITNVVWDPAIRALHRVPADYQGDLLDWLNKYVHPDDVHALYKNTYDIFDKKGPQENFSVTYRFAGPDGDWQYFELHALVDGSSQESNEVKIFGVAKDITSEVLKEKILEEQKNRLLNASRMTLLCEISSGIAHEINNPLTVIQARSFQLQQMCESGILDAAKIKVAAEGISKTTDKIAKIIKSMRSFSQNDNSQPVDKINVHELIIETLDFCKIRFYNHGIDVRLGAIPPDLEFEGRLIPLEETLLNIFNNAHDALVHTTASVPAEKWILIEAFDQGKDIEIDITDSGNGIDKEIAQNMMSPFFSTKELGRGMGLGLSIAAEIINKHHGTLTYDATSPKTKFRIKMPKLQPQ